jgi:NADPH:quinone reductase-like Zn-dependent oxidoreductase
MLIGRAKLRAGETVLIHGIGGGVGLAALQIARVTGARVIVTTSSELKRRRALALGAECVIDYLAEDVAQRVRELTKGRGVDVVVDTVGQATWSIDFSVVRRQGRIILCGVTSGPTAVTDLRGLYWRQLTILGSTLGSAEDFRLMLEAVTAARLKPIIDRTEPLERGREATARMESGEQFGKIVLRMSP